MYHVSLLLCWESCHFTHSSCKFVLGYLNMPFVYSLSPSVMVLSAPLSPCTQDKLGLLNLEAIRGSAVLDLHCECKWLPPSKQRSNSAVKGIYLMNTPSFEYAYAFSQVVCIAAWCWFLALFFSFLGHAGLVLIYNAKRFPLVFIHLEVEWSPKWRLPVGRQNTWPLLMKLAVHGVIHSVWYSRKHLHQASTDAAFYYENQSNSVFLCI